MTIVWIIVTVAFGVGSLFVGWCFGYDAGVQDNERKWLGLWPKLAKTSYDMAAAYGQQSIDDAVRAISAGLRMPPRP